MHTPGTDEEGLTYMYSGAFSMPTYCRPNCKMVISCLKLGEPTDTGERTDIIFRYKITFDLQQVEALCELYLPLLVL